MSDSVVLEVVRGLVRMDLGCEVEDLLEGRLPVERADPEKVQHYVTLWLAKSREEELRRGLRGQD